MMLQSKVRKTPGMLETISDRLDDIREKTHYFSPDVSNPMDEPSAFTHSSIMANIANLYQDTISTFNFRIQVSGDPRHLQNAENAAKIRALLLAGVRAAILWNQVGGKRWHMLFSALELDLLYKNPIKKKVNLSKPTTLNMKGLTVFLRVRVNDNFERIL